MDFIVEELRKQFDDKEVLKGVSYRFTSGKIYGLLGRNGAGKTTFFNCLNDDLAIDGGKFYLEENGAEIKVGVDDIGYVLSVPEVPSFLTGREFLQFFVDINQERIGKVQDLDAYFDIVGIKAEDRDLLLRDYSHGMKSKMQMLVNIIAKPKLLFLDEPLTSLDVVAAEEMKNVLRKQKQDCIIILSTHIMDLALSLCDEIVLLHNGVLSLVSDVDENGETVANQTLKEKIIEALKESE